MIQAVMIVVAHLVHRLKASKRYSSLVVDQLETAGRTLKDALDTVRTEDAKR